jgi:molybdate transport system substrate-binding protein
VTLRQAPLVLLLAAAGAAGCRSEPPPDPDRELVVFTAASLLAPFAELGEALERATPGLTVRLNAGGSQQLARQLAQGARADVVASADERWMRFLEERGLVERPEALARNELVAVFADRPELARMTLLNLASPGVKLVLAATEVPLGRYSREVLRKLGAAPGFGPDFAARVDQGAVSLEQNSSAVLARVRLGEADAAIVYGSDVRAADSVLRIVPIPAAYSVAAVYPIAVVRAAADTALARAFVALATGRIGSRILARHGFLPADMPSP